MRWIQTWDGEWVNMDRLAHIGVKHLQQNYFVLGYWPNHPNTPVNLYGPFNSEPEAQEQLDNLFTGK